MDEQFEEFEETLAVIPECFVYKIPPRTSTAGVKAADWELDKPLWKGRLRITGKGDTCFIQLEDITSNELFAVCKVKADAKAEVVEPVVDSSRYYILTIENERTGQHAFIGMGFNERSYSFEFKAALQDHKRRIISAREMAQTKREVLPALDLGLKQGQTIRVATTAFKNARPPRSSSTTGDDGIDDGDDGDFGLLPPPPTGTVVSRPAAAAAAPRPAAPPAAAAGAAPAAFPAAAPPAAAAAVPPGSSSPAAAAAFGNDWLNSFSSGGAANSNNNNNNFGFGAFTSSTTPSSPSPAGFGGFGGFTSAAPAQGAAAPVTFGGFAAAPSQGSTPVGVRPAGAGSDPFAKLSKPFF